MTKGTSKQSLCALVFKQPINYQLLNTVQIFQIIIKKPGAVIGIIIQRNKTVFQVKRNSITICINGYKSTTSFIVYDKIVLYEIQKKTTNTLSF